MKENSLTGNRGQEHCERLKNYKKSSQVKKVNIRIQSTVNYGLLLNKKHHKNEVNYYFLDLFFAYKSFCAHFSSFLLNSISAISFQVRKSLWNSQISILNRVSRKKMDLCEAVKIILARVHFLWAHTSEHSLIWAAISNTKWEFLDSKKHFPSERWVHFYHCSRLSSYLDVLKLHKKQLKRR